MWEYLKGLPDAFSVTVLIVGILGVVVISLKGSAVVKWGKNLVGLGTKAQESPSEEESKKGSTETSASLTSTGVPKQPKRSCGDCVLIMMGEREKYELNMSKKVDRILKTQMNIVEQKLIEIESTLINGFNEKLNIAKEDKTEIEMEYRLFYGLLRDALISVKNEIRRSFKENGYYELSDNEFNVFVKDKTKVIISMISQHLRNLYPSRGSGVYISDIIVMLESKQNTFHGYLSDVFVQAKQVIIDTDTEVNELKRSFSEWVDDFVN